MEKIQQISYKKRKKWPWILLIIFLVLIIASVSFGFFINHELKTPVGGSNTKIFSIEQGFGNAKIAEDLKTQGFIKYPWLFLGYIRYKNLNNKMQAGKYEITSDMTIPEIADILSSGKVKENQVTFPEGYNIEQMAQRLDEQKIVKAADFKKACKKYYPFEFLNDRPKNQNLEGFLFPDTYKFSLNITADDVVEKMLLNFDEKLDSKMRGNIKKTNMNIYEIITVASIIEKEVSNSEDRKIVAGIFYKRWNSDMSLQSCATLQYILKTNKKIFSIADTQVNSPYNTYINKGLPPGPICNPGLSAIEAAIYPKKTDYLYFLSDKDGKTIFAETYDEQLANQAKYLK
jgi:UPF0755 protein